MVVFQLMFPCLYFTEILETELLTNVVIGLVSVDPTDIQAELGSQISNYTSLCLEGMSFDFIIHTYIYIYTHTHTHTHPNTHTHIGNMLKFCSDIC